jgi:hypothetical protein
MLAVVFENVSNNRRLFNTGKKEPGMRKYSMNNLCLKFYSSYKSILEFNNLSASRPDILTEDT